ncbi:hypothetical protein [Ovoidimarina sediminis]|uniref:hypothetical protein n=1 Tax=Ovoidimarina sediminis TaxID=3079856 RepID=UPI00290A0D39|nr:hypothetical protein [Rhodophyticola sp. MJ-SS7]MDU8945942.1 hypothetical protein [Rhodophyticola sp. MJ-SS7]
MREIARILNIERDIDRVIGLHADLIRLGLRWRHTITNSPVDFPISSIRPAPSKRIRWLENKVEKIAKELLKNLDEEHDPYFSIWGTLDPDLVAFDREPARRALTELLEHLDHLIGDLYALQNEKAPHTGEMRIDLVCDLVELFKVHCPDLGTTRGTYDSQTKRWIGHLPEFVEAAFSEITGGAVMPGKKLDNLISLALKD